MAKLGAATNALSSIINFCFIAQATSSAKILSPMNIVGNILQQ